MAVSITSSPGTYPRPAGQPLIFTLFQATPPDRYMVEVFENDTYGGTGTSIAKLYLTPNSSGYAHFDLSDVVAGRVESCVSVGSPGGAIVGHTTTTAPSLSNQPVVRQYIVRAGQWNESTGETKNEDNANVNLFNGVAQISQGLNPDFSDYYPTASSQKVWMTDRKLNSSNKWIPISMADEDEGIAQCMKTLILGGPTDLVAKVRYQVYNDSNTLLQEYSNNVSISTTLSNNVFQIPLGPAQIDNLVAGGLNSAWHYINIAMLNASNQLLSKNYRVYKDCRPIKHDPVQLAWVNTLGAWDYLRFDGRNLKTTTSESKSYRKALGTYSASSFSFNPWERETTQYHKTAKEQYNLKNLYFTTEERELLQYCFRSKQVMFRVGTGDWLPCNVMTNTYLTQPAGSQMFEVSFDVELAQEIRC